MENYKGAIDVEFDVMLSIRLESFKPRREVGMFERLAFATKRSRDI